MARVEFKRIDKTFADGTRALKDLNITVDDGELLVMVGPSGCGKSTVLRLLAGLEVASRGDILIDGRSVLTQPPSQRDIAMVFQNYALYPHMSVQDNLAFPLRMAGRSDKSIGKKILTVAEMLGLTGVLSKKPAELSGGQRQRVAMGRAMVREPRVFLLDEPLSNLDPRLRGQVRSEISALQRRLNGTMIYVTHDQVEAMTLGHRVAVMNRGELQQIGTPQALYDQPCNRFVAGFLGDPPMNLCEAQVRCGDGEVRIKFGDTDLSLTPALERKLRGYTNDSVLVGIRPEALSVAQGVGPNLLKVKVVAEEGLGHERLLRTTAPGTTVDGDGMPQNPAELNIRLARGPAMRAGDAVPISVDMAQLHCFAPDGTALGES